MNQPVENLNFLYKFVGFKKHEEFAHLLGISRSTATKYLSGERAIPSKHLRVIADYVHLNDKDFKLESKLFIELIQNSMPKLPLLTFTSIELNKTKWKDIFDRIRGQYKVYYGSNEDENFLIVSLLCFERLTPNGIEVSFYNPYRDRNNTSHCYKYRGLAFRVNELLYIYAEQKNPNDYEVLSLIVSLSRTPEIEFLEGLIMGIGVKQSGESLIAAKSLICRREKRIIEDPAQEIGKSLGFLTRGSLPVFVQKFRGQKILLG